MQSKLLLMAIAAPFALAACGASYPAPTQRMADAMAAARSAQEVGAMSDPQGQLHLKMAQEQISLGSSLMASGDNRRADFVLLRAKSDAELALALAHAATAKAEAQRAVAQAQAASSQGGQ